MHPLLASEFIRARQLDLERALEADRAVRLARRARKRRRESARTEVTRRRAEVPVSTMWERVVGYSRAVKVGSLIEVSGTAAVGPDGRVLHPGDPYRQAKEALQIVDRSLGELGASLKDVVRTRVYLKKAWQWEPVGRAHGDAFGGIRPATTFVGAGGFVDPDMLVEIEATASVGEESHPAA